MREAEPSPPARQSLRTGASWALAGNLVYAASQWGILVAIARLGDPSALGDFTYALALTAPAVLLLTARNVQATDTEGAFTALDHLVYRLAGLAILFAAFALASSLWPDEPETSFLVFSVLLLKAAECTSDVLHGYLHAENRLDLVARSLAARATVGLTAFVSSYCIAHSLALATLFTATGWIAVSLTLDISLLRRLPRGLEPLKRRHGTLRKLSRSALAMGAATALYSFIPNWPRYTIERVHGAHALGIFSALAYLLVASRMLSTALTHALMPQLARAYHNRDYILFKRTTFRGLKLTTLASIAILPLAPTLGPRLAGAVYGSEYANHGPLLLWLAVAACLQQFGALLTASLSAAQRFRTLALGNTLALLVTAVAAIPLVTKYNLEGAAWCVCLALSVPLVVKTIALWVSLRSFPRTSLSAGTPSEATQQIPSRSERRPQ